MKLYWTAGIAWVASIALSLVLFVDWKKPRVVARDAKPEVIIKADRIFIEGKEVVMGQPIEIWKEVIPGTPRCDTDVDVACDWDAFGITLLTKRGLVNSFQLHLNPTPWVHHMTHSPGGEPFTMPPDPRPKNPFRGYLELDGYGIDANTQFWEIRDKVNAANPRRNVRCDLFTNNCGSTTSYFNDDATIYFYLDRTISERGVLDRISISRN